MSWAVWRALFLREATSRLANGRMAWLWLVGEPLAHIAFLMLMFSLVRTHGSVGAYVDFALFLGIGILGYDFFKMAGQRSMGAVNANRALFTYRQVRPVDTVLVRVFLEGVLMVAVAVALLTGTALAGVDVVPADPLRALAAVFLLWLCGVGVGLVLSVGEALVPEIGKVGKLLFQPLYFLSGIFFRPEVAPPAVRELLLLNPLLHGIEALRGAVFPGYHPLPEVSLAYLLFWGLAFVCLGLALHVRFDQRLASQ